MIVAPQPEAVEAGALALKRGGNAIDAAIACAFMQGVVDPQMAGVAGFGVMDHAAMTRRAAQLFAELKSETRPLDLVRTLSGGQRQAVAIARTRLAEAKLVLLDEPTASISVRQVAEVLDLMRRMRDHGQSIIFISHAMPHIFAVVDRITVLRRGRKVADKPKGATSPEEVTALITGAIERA